MYDDSQKQSVSQEEIQLREEYHRLSLVVKWKVVIWVFTVLMGVGAIVSYYKEQTMDCANLGFSAVVLFGILRYAENRSKKIKAYLDEHYPII